MKLNLLRYSDIGPVIANTPDEPTVFVHEEEHA